MKNTRAGFTLVELLVVILLIGILTAFGVPQYMKSMENSKAEDAASMANMVATANRMYALNNGNTFLSGQLSNSCNNIACSSASGACRLVACKYLAQANWDGMAYSFYAGNGTCSIYSGVGCARRKTTGTGSTTLSPYTNWGYSVGTDGVVQPQPTTNGPPSPTQ